MRVSNSASCQRRKPWRWPRRRDSTSWRSLPPRSHRCVASWTTEKREREAKRKQKSQTFKEIRLRVKIDVNDLRTKLRRAGEFLDEGDRVKVTVQFRGREMSHANLGRDLLDRAAGILEEKGVVERPPLLEGRNMFIVMAPPEKRAEKKNGTTEVAVPASATNGETIGDAVVAKGLTVEPEPTEQAQHAENEEPQGNSQAV
jgi:hypothetical protein